MIAERRAAIDDLPRFHVDAGEMSEVVAHPIVADHRHELPASCRRIVDLRIPWIEGAGLIDRPANRCDDGGTATEHIRWPGSRDDDARS